MKRASDKKVCYSPSCILFHNFIPQAKAMPEAKAMHHGKAMPEAKAMYHGKTLPEAKAMHHGKALPEPKAMHHGKSLPQAKVMPAQVFYCKSIDFIPHAKIIIRKWDGSGDHALRIMGKSGKINIVF